MAEYDRLVRPRISRQFTTKCPEVLQGVHWLPDICISQSLNPLLLGYRSFPDSRYLSLSLFDVWSLDDRRQGNTRSPRRPARRYEEQTVGYIKRD